MLLCDSRGTDVLQFQGMLGGKSVHGVLVLTGGRSEPRNLRLRFRQCRAAGQQSPTHSLVHVSNCGLAPTLDVGYALCRCGREATFQSQHSGIMLSPQRRQLTTMSSGGIGDGLSRGQLHRRIDRIAATLAGLTNRCHHAVACVRPLSPCVPQHALQGLVALLVSRLDLGEVGCVSGVDVLEHRVAACLRISQVRCVLLVQLFELLQQLLLHGRNLRRGVRLRCLQALLPHSSLLADGLVATPPCVAHE